MQQSQRRAHKAFLKDSKTSRRKEKELREFARVFREINYSDELNHERILD